MLLAIKSCAADILAGHNEVIRQTWGKHIQGATLRFFVGNSPVKLLPDEIRVDAPDGYEGLPRKVCAIVRWALVQKFNYLFLADTDTFVRPDILLASGVERHDITGYFAHRIPGKKDDEGYYAWPSGGGGYWMSAKAAEHVAANTSFEDWAEDRMVGQLLGPHIESGALTAINRKDYGAPDHTENLVTAHYESMIKNRKYDPMWMRRLYRKFYQQGKAA